MQHVPPPPPPSGRVTAAAAVDPSMPSAPPVHPFAALPEGWTTACDVRDGRMYYWNMTTGQTCWSHPNFLAQEQDTTNYTDSSRGSFWQPSTWFPNRRQTDIEAPPPQPKQHFEETTRRPPDNHECYCVTALLLFAPIGLLACYHSFQVHRKWRQGRYGEAYGHARQAPQYACAATAVGVVFWIFVLVIREESKVVDWRWPDWNLD